MASMAMVPSLAPPEFDFRRSVSQRRTYRSCGYKYLLDYGQGWRSKLLKGQYAFGNVMELVATGIACGLITTADEAERYFNGIWWWQDPTQMEWSQRVTFEILATQGAALARVIVPEIQEHILVPDDVELMVAQQRITYQLGPESPELCIPDLWCWVRQDLFSDHLPTILDFKTADRAYVPESIELDEQLTDYQLAEESIGRVPAQLGLCVMIRGKDPRVQWLLAPRRSDAVLERFTQSAVAIDRQIKAGVFYQNDRSCFAMGTCPYVPLCYASQRDQLDAKLKREKAAIDLFTGWDND
jgi:hypothetical protein